jgi:hypothetical protein
MLATATWANCLVTAGTRSDRALMFPSSVPTEVRPLPTDAATAQARAALDDSPLYFVENRGLVDSQVGYYIQGPDSVIYFTSQGLTFTLIGNDAARAGCDAPSATDDAAAGPMSIAEGAGRTTGTRRWTIRLDFVGARARVKPVGLDPASTVVSYFTGPKDQWKTGLKTYSRVMYRNLWPGIDLIYTVAAHRLKYEFVIKPGADPRRIRLAYRGAQVRLTEEGRLETKTPVASLLDEKPYSYQRVEGRNVETETAYELGPADTTDGVTFGFRLGRYDRTRQLVLDPAVVVYSGFVGGSKNDGAFHVAVDAAGNAYIAGMAASNPAEGFPATVGPNTAFTPDRGSGPIGDRALGAFVAKVKPDGSGFVYCGYIGGAGNQMATGIAVDSAGNAYVCGATDSKPAQGFPLTVGPKLTYGGGSFTAGGINDSQLGDGFVAKVNAAGTGLVYCGYIGGEGDDFAYGVAVDGAGNAYVTGETSSKATFPLTTGPSLTYGGGSYDAFVAKVKPDGSGFAYCGYIGGSALDRGYGIAVDSQGSAYVTGLTTSNPASLGVTVGPKLTRSCADTMGNCTDFDAFVAKVKPDGTGLNYLGYIGGTGNDRGLAIAVDGAGNAYVTGQTYSPASSFMPTGGPGLTLNGLANAFVAKVKADGTGLVYSGYVGGSGADCGTGIAVDPAGNAYVVGSTISSDLPVTDGSSYKGGSAVGDVFVTKVKTDGTGLLSLGYFGGTGDDVSTGIALDASGNVYICGSTTSTEATFPVAGGPVLTNKGSPDAFIAKLSGLGAPPQPDFALSFDQPAITTPAGSKVGITLNISRLNGFTGNVNISPPTDLPRGIKIPLDPSTPTAGNSLSFKIKVKGSAQPGTDLIVFTGVDDSGKLSHTVTLTLMVQ